MAPRQSYALFYAPFAFQVLCALGIAWGGAYTHLVAFAGFVVLPILDWAFGQDSFHPQDSAHVKELAADETYAWVTWLWVPAQWALVLWTCLRFATDPLSLSERVGLVMSVGIINGGGFTVAHELCHRHNTTERVLSQLLLLSSAYMHFFIEHPLGHHRNVATPRDPASARLGDNFWTDFFPRTLRGSYASAWALERKRLDGHVLTPRNRMLWYALLPVLTLAALAHAWGALAAVCFAAQAYIAVVLFEVINYVEHYGLERREVAPGKYESVKLHHSWNSNTLIGNLVFLKLPRHSDHHTHPGIRYQALRHDAHTPMYPLNAGYSLMALLALLPPLWFRVMDPAAKAERARAATLAAKLK